MNVSGARFASVYLDPDVRKPDLSAPPVSSDATTATAAEHSNRPPVFVVGAGMVGLIAAVALSEAGIPVHVCEAADAVGGRREVPAGIARRELALGAGAN